MTFQIQSSDRRKRSERGSVDRQRSAQFSAGVHVALHGNERMRQRECHRPQRIIELHIGAKIDRRRLEQLRFRPGDAQPIEHRVEADRTAVALDVRAERTKLQSARVQSLDSNLSRGVRALERSVHMGLQRHAVPRHVLPRRHRRRVGRHVEIHPLIHQIHGAGARSAQRPCGDGEAHRFCVTRPLGARLNRKRAQIRQLREAGEQTVLRLADVEVGFEIRGIDASIEFVASRGIQPVHGKHSLGVLQRCCVDVALQAHRRSGTGDRRTDVQAIDVDLGDVDAHRQLEWLRTLFTLGRRQAQKLHLTRAQQLNLELLVRERHRRPLERNVVRTQPERRCIADLGTGNAQIVGKVSRDAG